MKTILISLLLFSSGSVFAQSSGLSGLGGGQTYSHQPQQNYYQQQEQMRQQREQQQRQEVIQQFQHEQHMKQLHQQNDTSQDWQKF